MRKVIVKLIGFLAPFRKSVFYSIMLNFATIASGIGLMATSAWLISKSGLQPSIADLGVSAVIVRFFGVFRGVFRYLERLISHDVSFRLLANLRVWLYDKLEPLAPAHLSDYHSGDIWGRIVSDVETLQDFYTRVIVPPIVAAIVALCFALFMGIFDIWVMLTAMAFILFASTVLPLMAWWQSQHAGREWVETRAELNEAVLEQIHGVADIIAFNRTDDMIQQLDELTDQYSEHERRMAWLDSIQTGLGILVVHLAAVSVLWVAIPRVEGIFLATLALATIASFEAFTPLAITTNHLKENVEAGKRLFDLVDVDIDDETQTSVDEEIAIDVPQAVTFERVTFAYGDDVPIFTDFSLHIPAGKRVAIVGNSGVGKSTLGNILLKFWGYQDGYVRIGDYDLADLAPQQVRELCAMMSQQTHLFNTTIRENIRIARDTADDATLQQAAQLAQIDDFILGLPDGYKTVVGERGARLSGGERQRIALARMLLKDAPVLIFDEPTANLDAVTEQAIVDAMMQVTDDKTVLYITHRLTMLDQMDEIIVLEHGNIVERGTHEALLMQQGAYYDMWRLQNDVIDIAV